MFNALNKETRRCSRTASGGIGSTEGHLATLSPAPLTHRSIAGTQCPFNALNVSPEGS